MNNWAVRACGLSKKYHIGVERFGYRTLRESITHSFRSMFKPRGKRATDDIIWAVKDLDFEFPASDVIGIIGRNGSGKSTLLKILAGITEPTRGFAELRGRPGALLEVGTGFHAELTGRENVFLNGAILGMRKSELNDKFDSIVAFSGIEKFIDTPVKYYSSGMYLRLAFAVASHLDPDILLVDEVLAVGDAEFQKKCIGKMGSIAREGRTVLFVSHNLAAVNRLCNKGIVLDKGRIIAMGDVREAISTYSRLMNSESLEIKGQSRAITIGCLEINRSDQTSVAAGDAFSVSFQFIVAKPVQRISFRVTLRDPEDQIIMYSAISDKECDAFTRPGKYACTIHVPPLWIAPGMYGLQVKCIGEIPGVRKLRAVTDPFMLGIKSDHPENVSFPGYIQPACRWRFNDFVQ